MIDLALYSSTYRVSWHDVFNMFMTVCISKNVCCYIFSSWHFLRVSTFMLMLAGDGEQPLWFDPRGGSQNVFLFSTLKVIFLAVGFLYLYLSDAVYILCTIGVQKAISHLLENKAKLHTKHHVERTYHLNAKYLFKRKVSSSLKTILDHLWGFLSYRNTVMTGLMNLGQAIVQPVGRC